MKLDEYLQKRYTEQTAKAYQREIESYLQNYPAAAKGLHADIVNYLGRLRQRYYNARTISRILSSIKAYYDFLSYTGKRKDNPAKSIRLRDKQSRDIQLQDLFTPEELESLLNRKERYNPLEYRNKVLMSFLIYQAVLPRELAGIMTDDINLEQGTVYIKATTKTNARTLQLKPDQIMLLYHYINEVRPTLMSKAKKSRPSESGPKKNQNTGNETTLLISHRGNPETVSRLVSHVKRMKHKFTGRTLNMQTIRQSVITNLLKSGHDLRVVQVFAGHKYPSTTEKYKQTSVEALQEQIKKYHPMK